MRALLRADRADDELAQALARAGLYVERVQDASSLDLRDVAVVDPRLLAGREAKIPVSAPRSPVAERSLEDLAHEKLALLLEKLGSQRLPALHETVLAQVERALLKLAVARTSALGDAAELLGIHRNTLARRLEALGLREKSRGGR